MNRLFRTATLAAMVFANPALAVAQEAQPAPDQKPVDQKPADQSAAPPDAAKPAPPPEAEPARPSDKPADKADAAPAAPIPGTAQPNQVIPGSPDLSVATVRMEGGMRASRLIGAAVYNASNEKVGSVDDLVLNHDNKVALGVISVGGVLGVGGKLVAVPFEALHVDAAGKVVLPEANKEALGKMPGFTYAH